MHHITNKKGQALIEFVIILPVVLMILFVIIDFSNIFYQKNHLENVVSDVASLKENGKSNKYIEKTISDNVKINYKQQDNTLLINVSKDIHLITPLSSIFFDNPYKVETQRTIIYEQ